MSNTVKSKFAGLLRGLLRRFDDNGATVVAPLYSIPMAATASPRGISPAATPPSKTQRINIPLPAPATASPGGLQLPLPSIIAVLPIDLRAKLIETPPASAFILIPVEKVLSQLAHGSVKITLGELRAARPGLFANSDRENDTRQIALPLNEIITRISPTLLSRRAVKKVELADDVAGPFGARTQSVNFTPAKATPVPEPKTSEPVPVPAAPKSGMPPAFVPKKSRQLRLRLHRLLPFPSRPPSLPRPHRSNLIFQPRRLSRLRQFRFRPRQLRQSTAVLIPRRKFQSEIPFSRLWTRWRKIGRTQSRWNWFRQI